MKAQDEQCEDRDAGQSYAVCYRCRKRKVRCTRERPSCSNCINGGYECEWSEKGKKPNQALLLSTAVSELTARLDRLEATVATISDMVQKLNTTATTPIFPSSPLPLADPFSGCFTPKTDQEAVTPPFRHQSDAAVMDCLATHQHFHFYHAQIQDEHDPTSKADVSSYPALCTFPVSAPNAAACTAAYHDAWTGAKQYPSNIETEAECMLTDAAPYKIGA